MNVDKILETISKQWCNSNDLKVLTGFVKIVYQN